MHAWRLIQSTATQWEKVDRLVMDADNQSPGYLGARGLVLWRDWRQRCWRRLCTEYNGQKWWKSKGVWSESGWNLKARVEGGVDWRRLQTDCPTRICFLAVCECLAFSYLCMPLHPTSAEFISSLQGEQIPLCPKADHSLESTFDSPFIFIVCRGLPPLQITPLE